MARLEQLVSRIEESQREIEVYLKSKGWVFTKQMNVRGDPRRCQWIHPKKTESDSDCTEVWALSLDEAITLQSKWDEGEP